MSQSKSVDPPRFCPPRLHFSQKREGSKVLHWGGFFRGGALFWEQVPRGVLRAVTFGPFSRLFFNVAQAPRGCVVILHATRWALAPERGRGCRGCCPMRLRRDAPVIDGVAVYRPRDPASPLGSLYPEGTDQGLAYDRRAIPHPGEGLLSPRTASRHAAFFF